MAASFPWEVDYDRLPSVSLKVQKALEDGASTVRILGAAACLAAAGVALRVLSSMIL